MLVRQMFVFVPSLVDLDMFSCRLCFMVWILKWSVSLDVSFISREASYDRVCSPVMCKPVICHSYLVSRRDFWGCNSSAEFPLIVTMLDMIPSSMAVSFWWWNCRSFILVVKLLTVSWTEIGSIGVTLFHFSGEMACRYYYATSTAVSSRWWNWLQSLLRRLISSVLRCFIVMVK